MKNHKNRLKTGVSERKSPIEFGKSRSNPLLSVLIREIRGKDSSKSTALPSVGTLANPLKIPD